MKYYLLSEQDLYEISLEIETVLYEIKQMIKAKEVIEEEERD